MTTYRGEYKPPVIGANAVPIKITGEGVCHPTEEGIQVEGFENLSRLNSTLLVFFFFAAFAATVALKVAWEGMPDYLMAFPLIMVIAPFLKNRGSDPKGQAISMLIPWSHIKKVSEDKQTGCLLVHVKSFKHEAKKYKGALYFAPQGNKDVLKKEIDGFIK